METLYRFRVEPRREGITSWTRDRPNLYLFGKTPRDRSKPRRINFYQSKWKDELLTASVNRPIDQPTHKLAPYSFFDDKYILYYTRYLISNLRDLYIGLSATVLVPPLIICQSCITSQWVHLASWGIVWNNISLIKTNKCIYIYWCDRWANPLRRGTGFISNGKSLTKATRTYLILCPSETVIDGKRKKEHNFHVPRWIEYFSRSEIPNSPARIALSLLHPEGEASTWVDKDSYPQYGDSGREGTSRTHKSKTDVRKFDGKIMTIEW